MVSGPSRDFHLMLVLTAIAVFVFRTFIHIINGISSNVVTTVAALSVDSGKIIDSKFLDSNTLILLVSKQGMFNINISRPIGYLY